jgi:thioredoxin
MADTLIVEATDATFEQQVEKAKLPVTVMFYSPTCAFCRMMEPYFAQYAAEYREKVAFVRVNVMANLFTGERFGVLSTPTFAFFCGGKPVQSMVGAVYPTLLKNRIEDVLLHGKECALKSTEINYEISGYG